MTTTQTISRVMLDFVLRSPECYSELEVTMARMLLAGLDSEPVTVPDHITYIQSPTLENVLSDAEDNSPMAHAARILAREVKFWRSVPLYAAPPAPVAVPDNLIETVKNIWAKGNCRHFMTDAVAAQIIEACRAAMQAVDQAAPQQEA